MDKFRSRHNRSCLTLAIVVVCAFLFNYNLARAAGSRFKKKNITFESFDESSRSSLKFEGDSDISLGALQLTPETQNEGFVHNRSGRVMYAHPFRLWSSEINNSYVLASFNTTFVINLYREAEWVAGHGLAFVIAPNLSIPSASYGQWLGLTNASTDGHSGNQIVAVEFDTGDPKNHHIGLNINSVRSRIATPLNLTLSPPPPGVNYSVWVDYSGSSKRMEVYMAKEGEEKPGKAVLRSDINLKEYLRQDSYMGFAGSTGDPQIELNCVLRWELGIDWIPRGGDRRKWMRIGVGVGVSVAMIVVLVGGGTWYWRRRRRSLKRLDDDDAAEEMDEFWRLKRLPGMPREFKYKELKKATNGFQESRKLGEGGFGVVYQGVLDLDHHQSIAVKKFSRDSSKSKEDFLAELTIIHRLRHKHLVRLVGWCYEKGKLLLVYDFMPNGSLEKHLYGVGTTPEHQDTILTWNRRLNILAGVASGLHYLHNEYDQKVIHRDLKSSNILLDADFNARLGDFGLARALEDQRNSYAELGLGGVPGTMGYVAPECFHTGRATPESDVFGFGAVVLEVVCGRGPGIKIHHSQHLYSLVDWIWMLHREGRIQEAVDERLKNNFVEDEAVRLLLLGLACSHPVDSERPKTQAILQIISGTLPPPRVPPFKPVFTWPSGNTSMSNTITNTSLSTGISLSSSSGSLRSHSLTKLQRSSSQLPV